MKTNSPPLRASFATTMLSGWRNELFHLFGSLLVTFVHSTPLHIWAFNLRAQHQLHTLLVNIDCLDDISMDHTRNDYNQLSVIFFSFGETYELTCGHWLAMSNLNSCFVCPNAIPLGHKNSLLDETLSNPKYQCLKNKVNLSNFPWRERESMHGMQTKFISWKIHTWIP